MEDGRSSCIGRGLGSSSAVCDHVFLRATKFRSQWTRMLFCCIAGWIPEARSMVSNGWWDVFVDRLVRVGPQVAQCAWWVDCDLIRPVLWKKWQKNNAFAQDPTSWSRVCFCNSVGCVACSCYVVSFRVQCSCRFWVSFQNFRGVVEAPRRKQCHWPWFSFFFPNNFSCQWCLSFWDRETLVRGSWG